MKKITISTLILAGLLAGCDKNASNSAQTQTAKDPLVVWAEQQDANRRTNTPNLEAILHPVQADNPLTHTVEYGKQVNTGDSNFRNEILPGVTKDLSALANAKFNNSSLYLPISPDLSTNNIANLTLSPYINGAVWRFDIDGKWSVAYTVVSGKENDGKNSAGKSNGYLSFFGPKGEEGVRKYDAAKLESLYGKMHDLRFEGINSDMILAEAFQNLFPGSNTLTYTHLLDNFYPINLNTHSAVIVDNGSLKKGSHLIIKGINPKTAALAVYSVEK